MVDQSDLEALERAVRPDTTLIWVETPTNPLLTVVDIEAVVARSGRGPGGRGQHIRHAGHPASTRVGRRRRGAFGHQVPGRPLGRGGRPGGVRRRGAARTSALRPERGGRGARPVRLLPGSPRPAHAPPSGGGTRRERARGERVPAYGRCAGRALAGLRRHGLVPAPGRRSDRVRHQGVLAGGVPGRRGVADRGAAGDDRPVGGGLRRGGAGRPGAAVLRDRGRRGPGG